MNYDPETNIASFELTKAPIVNAIELGGFIIHLSKKNTPVLIEVLDASKFKTQFNRIEEIPDIQDILSAKSLSHIDSIKKQTQ
ncbi:DUF2283 domain-containing protein [Patescibacteria group bacterium]|nr:DUF2283 domain-containing protein [Patescibacteria group bacterium]